ncbi:MAG: hypothetical protein O8C64_08775 [Candidatus Methanoperedens sp.]|nr:hypothetical protein [Candidatus Methanoperedens sp.]MCZ7405568.1 hypothetical protein [Candidatus Methanoperedens sp.]
MIEVCDNAEYLKWIEMSEPIFENMNINISKIHFIMDITSNKFLPPNSSGRTSKMLEHKSIIIIQICNNLSFNEFIQTYAHEVGHATQKFGYSENYNESGVLEESIALKFEEKFLKKFNKKYDKNIPVNTVFTKSKYKKANCLKKIVILITKSEYKLKK